MFNDNQLYEVNHPLYKFLDHLESRLVTIFPRKKLLHGRVDSFITVLQIAEKGPWNTFFFDKKAQLQIVR